MPLVRRPIAYAEKYHDAGILEDNVGPADALQNFTFATLSGVLQQMGMLSAYAAELMEGLAEEATHTAQRIVHISARVDVLSEQLPKVGEVYEQEGDPMRFFRADPVEYQAPNPQYEQLFTKESLPPSIKATYERCQPPPNLSVFDKFTPTGPGTCLKGFTNPSFFFEEWVREQMRLQEIEERRKKEAKDKRKKELRAARGKGGEGKKVKMLQQREFSSMGKEFDAAEAKRMQQSQVQHVSKASEVKRIEKKAAPPAPTPVHAAPSRGAPAPPPSGAPPAPGRAPPAPPSGGPPAIGQLPPPPAPSMPAPSRGGGGAAGGGGGGPPPPPPIPAVVKAGPPAGLPSPAGLPPPPVVASPAPPPPPPPPVALKRTVKAAPPPPPPPPGMPTPPPPPAGGGAAPPPPPPPPAGGGGGGGGMSLLEQIAAGKKLRKAAPKPKPKAQDSRSELMDAIRGGSVKLRKVERPAPKKNNTSTSTGVGVADILARRLAILGNDSDSDSDDDYDSDWDD